MQTTLFFLSLFFHLASQLPKCLEQGNNDYSSMKTCYSIFAIVFLHYPKTNANSDNTIRENHNRGNKKMTILNKKQK